LARVKESHEPAAKKEKKLTRPPLRRLTGEELRAWRKRHGLTQQELAWLLGLSREAISNWERGTRTIPPYLCLVLDVLEKHLAEQEDAEQITNKVAQIFRICLDLMCSMFRGATRRPFFLALFSKVML